MRKILLLVFLLLNITFFFAQKRTEKAKVVLLLKSALEYEYSNWNKSQSFIDEAEQIANQSHDDELKAWYKSGAAIVFYDRDLLDISLKYTLDAYSYFKDHNKPKSLECESLLAIIYARMNNQKEALKYFRSYYKEIKDQDPYLSLKTLNNIGNLYLTNKKQDSAYSYFKAAIGQLTPESDKNLVVMLTANIARSLVTKNPEIAETYFLKASTKAKISAVAHGDQLVAIWEDKREESSEKIYAQNILLPRLGTGATNSSLDFKLYPNPAVSSINIITGKNVKVSNLFDLNGRELLSSTKKKIKIDQLPQGIYVLKTTFEDETTTSHKIIKK